MDISGLSASLSLSQANLSQNGLSQKVSLAVLDKAMDLNEEMGAGLVRMMDAAAMENSVNPAVGGNFDMRI